MILAIRDALRGFQYERAYVATTVVTLALTIGATTAAFSIVNGVLLKPLPFRVADRLVSLREVWREVSEARTLEVNERHFEYWRERAQSFTSMAQYWVLPANLTGRGEAAQITIVRCSGSLFDTLQVHASIGRALNAGDDPERALDVATITDALWRQRFGADPRIVGSSIVLDGKPYTVTGVLPPDFRLPNRDQLTAAVDVFIPYRFAMGWVGEHNNQAIGRLREGVTLEQALAELNALQAQVGVIATERAGEPVTLSAAMTPLADAIVGGSRRGLPSSRYLDRQTQQRAYDRMLTAVQGIPGVESVSTSSLLPLRGYGQINFIAPEGAPWSRAEMPRANFRFVAPDYFRTLSITVRRGRTFRDDERDPKRPTPALVSETTAARLWPDEDAVGKRFTRGIPSERGFEVVGIVADARITTLDGVQPLMVYVPYWWQSRTSASLLIKTATDPASTVAAVRRAVHEVDPEIAVGESRSLDDLVDASVALRRYQAQLFVAFGVVALFVATVGIYAVTAYGVSRRRREMNLRVALGARRSQVIGLILRQGMAPVLLGVAVGVGGALALGNVLASLLFEIRPRDPAIIAIVVATVVFVGLLTSALATRQGLSIEPSAALRAE